ncbi:maturation protein [ssRNA phage SRR6960509_15]|uniref:Maturation protein n=1 Tax=ssRNA phage SRR6960509_15 TaxID=2786526 RepID=A0A8S5L5C5_9VIRU|nr:maturation protein [ssRNA phage SRR6960509_15]DAD52565.1 TPA_asm: maturation protein [ssRNA phage SRR6960509_15]
MATRYRERLNNRASFLVGQEFYWYKFGTVWDWKSSTAYNASGRPLGASAGAEYVYDELHKGPPYLEGGPFNLWRHACSYWDLGASGGTIFSSPSYTGTRRKYEGGFICNHTSVSTDFGIDISPYSFNIGKRGYTYTPTGEHTWGDASSYGTVTWKKYRPGKSSSDAAVFLGELKDLPRMLRSTAKTFYDLYRKDFRNYTSWKRFSKHVSNSWLNHQFGWLPFVSDLCKFYKTYKTLDEQIARIRRRNGQWHRRGGTLFRNEDTTRLRTVSDAHCSYPYLGGAFTAGLPSTGRHYVDRIKRERVWFTALFRYWIPDIDSVQWPKRVVREIFGLTPNPALIWELTPWSWLADWFSNVGEYFTNMDTGWAQNLTAKYAYVMRETEHALRITSEPMFPGRPLKHVWTYSCQRKHRAQANPFGFEVSWEDLSPRQWSILSALGITRSLR